MMAGNQDNPIQPQIDVQKHLKGMDYPAKKEDLVRHAEQQGAPEEILALLEELPERTYDSPAEVTKHVSREL
jgi:hypothetical protein